MELASSPEMAAISDLARAEGVAVALPYAERHEGRLYNSCALFDCRGDLVLNYRKVHLLSPRSVTTPPP